MGVGGFLVGTKGFRVGNDGLRGGRGALVVVVVVVVVVAGVDLGITGKILFCVTAGRMVVVLF